MVNISAADIKYSTSQTFLFYHTTTGRHSFPELVSPFWLNIYILADHDWLNSLDLRYLA